MKQAERSFTRPLARGAVSVTVPLLVALGCGDTLADDCRWTTTCPETSGGTAGSNGSNGGLGGLGGKSSDGGRSAGGASTRGGAPGENGGDTGAGSGGMGTAGAPPCNGACGGNTPVCDTDNARCVACLVPTDCPAQTPVCEPTTNTCVGCLASTDCAAPNPACDTVTSTCVECNTSTDCGGATPFCDLDAHVCVACVYPTHCMDAQASYCAASTHTCRPCTNSTQCSQIIGKPQCLSGTCVECTTQADCTSATASQCDTSTHVCKACATDAHCSNIAGKNVCSNGACVQCTGAKSSACGTDTQSGTPLVCDSLKHSCTTTLAKSAGLCAPCLSDAQCKAGEVCVLDTLGSGSTAKTIGYFCHWKKGDTVNGAPADCFASGRPYSATLAAVTSIDGQTGDICGLSVSSCPANNEFKAKNCAPAGTPDDTQCGAAAPADAKCIQVTGSAAYRCTMRCGSDEDCPDGFPCNLDVSPRVCKF